MRGEGRGEGRPEQKESRGGRGEGEQEEVTGEGGSYGRQGESGRREKRKG